MESVKGRLFLHSRQQGIGATGFCILSGEGEGDDSGYRGRIRLNRTPLTLPSLSRRVDEAQDGVDDIEGDCGEGVLGESHGVLLILSVGFTAGFS